MTSSRHRSADSRSNTPSENENDDENNQTENQSAYLQNYVDPLTNQTETTKQNPL